MEAETRKLYPKAQIIISNDDTGIGKGLTLKRGLWKADRGVVCFINGDMDIHPKEIDKLLNHINYHDIVIGIKDISHYPFKRRMISRVCRWLVKIMFRLPVTDTQTGIKVFKRYALHDWDTRGFACDVEILADAHKRGYSIKEIQVEANNSKSKGLRVLLKTYFELLKIKRKINEYTLSS